LGQGVDAGVIGAAHNGSGIVGVMANVKIIPIKFLSDEGSGETIDANLR
jgi:subtilisin family serine protease